MSDVVISPVTVISPLAAPPDTVTLTVAGAMISGWTDVRITRRCEAATNDFEVGLTASNPSNGSDVVAYAGQQCVLKIGRDTVLTGYIDRDFNAGDANSHRLGIQGRGKCSDLVDCAAVSKGGQISGSSALQIAARLAEPYDITVNAGPGLDIEKAIPQFNLNYGETAVEIIDRICTYGGLMFYEDELGNLLLAQVGATTAASGFVYGQNVQSWSVTNSMDERFSDYVCAAYSTGLFGDIGDDPFYFTAHDPNVPRYRNQYLVTKAVSGSRELCELRALWEAARRAGRGTSVTITTGSWRDAGGTLWAPNTLVPVTLPGLRQGANTMLCISEATFVYGEDGGKIAELVLLPPSGLTKKPIQIQPTPYATAELV